MYKSRRRTLNGGNASNLLPVPVQSYGFDYGGSQSENAIKMLEKMADNQNMLNNTLAGGSKRRKIRGGASDGTIQIPQFTQIGPQVSNQDANSASYLANSLLINAMNNAANDSKVSIAASSQNGGLKKKMRRMSSKKKSFKTHSKTYSRKYGKVRKNMKSKKSKTHKYRK